MSVLDNIIDSIVAQIHDEVVKSIKEYYAEHSLKMTTSLEYALRTFRAEEANLRDTIEAQNTYIQKLQERVDSLDKDVVRLSAAIVDAPLHDSAEQRELIEERVFEIMHTPEIGDMVERRIRDHMAVNFDIDDHIDFREKVIEIVDENYDFEEIIADKLECADIRIKF